MPPHLWYAIPYVTSSALNRPYAWLSEPELHCEGLPNDLFEVSVILMLITPYSVAFFSMALMIFSNISF